MKGAVWLMLIESVLGWSAPIHVSILQIAQQYMTKKNWNTVDDLVQKDRVFCATYPKHAKLTTISNWPDALRDEATMNSTALHYPNMDGGMTHQMGHYVPLPTIYDHRDIELDRSAVMNDEHHAVNMLEKILHHLKNAKKDALVPLIGYLVHVWGDIHNPVHTGSMYSAVFPKGDMGGNRFRFVWSGQRHLGKSMHSLWDKAGGIYGSRLINAAETLTPTLEEFYQDMARRIVRKLDGKVDVSFDYDAEQIAAMSYNEFLNWIDDNKLIHEIVLEGNDILEKEVYRGVNTTNVGTRREPRFAFPDKEYIQKVQKLAEIQIFKAGKRLALVLSQVAQVLRKRERIAAMQPRRKKFKSSNVDFTTRGPLTSPLESLQLR